MRVGADWVDCGGSVHTPCDDQKACTIHDECNRDFDLSALPEYYLTATAHPAAAGRGRAREMDREAAAVVRSGRGCRGVMSVAGGGS